MHNDSLMVRVGGGYVKFEEHVLKQDRYYQRMLVVFMIKSGESLEWVVEQLIANKKITNQLVDLSSQHGSSNVRKSARRSSVSLLPKSPASPYRRNQAHASAFGSSTPTGRGSANLRKNSSNNLRQQNFTRGQHQ